MSRRDRTEWTAARLGRWAGGAVVLAGVSLLLASCGVEDRAADSDSRHNAASAPEPAIRNVILITLDTTRADALGAYGQSLPASPNIDRMAAEGVLFAQVASSAPSTLPSHATILTGKHPYAHGARSNSGYVLSEANTSLAEVLRSHGYRTAAEIAAPVIGRHTLLDQGFDSYRDSFSPGVGGTDLTIKTTEGNRRVQLRERMATDITKFGIEFLRVHRDEKFFLWLHFFDAHKYHTPPPEFAARLPESPYHAEILFIDHEIGRLLSVLEGLGLKRRTLVVLTADHGESLKQHGELNHSYFVYDSTIRVPLILWGPSVLRPGSVVESLVRTVDIAPTVLDLLDLPPLEQAQGVSLASLIRGEERDLNLMAYGESIDIMPFGTSPLRFVRKGRWKYLHKVNPELYDVVADPGELNDLAARRPEVVEQLRSEMERLITSAPATPSGAEVPIDAETREQLQALGYMVASAPQELDDELATLTDLRGSDPRDLLDDLRLMSRATAAQKNKLYGPAAERFARLWQKYRTEVFGLSLARMLVKLERFDAAADLLEEMSADAPDNLDYRVRLADLLFKSGRISEAEPGLRHIIETNPCTADARALLAHLAYSRKRFDEQLELLRVGVEECPESTKLANNLAYALATTPREALRDGARAVRLAERVIESVGTRDPSNLDTLAAAYAEIGDFARAVVTMEKSIELSKQLETPKNLEELQRHLTLFESKQPLRDPSG